MSSTQGGAREQYVKRRDRAQEELQRLDQRSAWLANSRALTFGLFAVGLGLVVFGKIGSGWLWAVLASLATFVALAGWHGRVIAEEARQRVLQRLNERGLARLNGAWHAFPEHGGALLPGGHLFAGDLDVLGQGSLFQRLDETGTVGGERALAAWLLAAPPPLAELHARQAAVRELASQLDFRQRLVSEARLAGDARLDPSRLIAWVEGPTLLGGVAWVWPVAHLLPVVTLAIGAAALAEALPSTAFWGLVLVQAALAAATRKPLTALYETVSVGERGLVRFEDTFRAIAEARFESGRLQALQRGLISDGPGVPERLTRFSRLVGFAQLRQSGLMHPIFNVLLLWDVHVLFRLERWRTREGAGVRRWFDALAELEALSSCATLPFENPAWVFPEVVDGPLRFEAKGLGHPLLERSVRNDVSLPGPGHAWVITGSNMSGKTTLLRAMGLNTVMALAGLPVCAESFSISRLTVVTSMRVKDSLERGVSYFYAEVQRIKALLDAARAAPASCLFLLDELFMGTNTRERQIASLQLMRKLLDTGGGGALTTHDLTLCSLEQERPGQVRNVHFRDAIVNDEMTFDYRLHDGVVQTSNALEVLRRAGVPLDER